MSMLNQEVSIGRYISVLYRQSQTHISKELTPYKIGSGQYPILLVLQRNDGIMQDKLSAIGVDKANVARAVAKLQEKGYVERRPDPEDKRVWRIYLTESGHNVIPIIKKVLSEWNSILSKGMDPQDQEMLIRALKIMAANVGFEA